jgi:uncharacterized protein YkwD
MAVGLSSRLPGIGRVWSATRRRILVALVVLGAIATAVWTPGDSAHAMVVLGAEQQAAIAEINAVRSANGLSQLAPSPALGDAAVWMAKDLALRTSNFSHVDSVGRGPYRRALAFGYPADEGLAENIVIGIAAPEHAVEGWLASSNHRHNLLTEAWHTVGIARYRDDSNPWEWFWVAVFGTQDQGSGTPAASSAGSEGDSADSTSDTPADDPAPAERASREALAVELATESNTASIEATAIPRPLTRDVALDKGWNLVSWTGPSSMLQDALAEAVELVDWTFRWRNGARAWDLQEVSEAAVRTGDVIWVHSVRPTIWTQAIAPPGDPVSIGAGWQPIAWHGADGATLADVLGPARSSVDHVILNDLRGRGIAHATAANASGWTQAVPLGAVLWVHSVAGFDWPYAP